MLSKHTDERYIHPNDHEQPRSFIDHLSQYLRKNPHDAIVPLADRSHTILSKHKERITETGTSVGVEDWDRFTSANNKKRLFDLAKTLPVPTPDTRSPGSVPEVR